MLHSLPAESAAGGPVASPAPATCLQPPGTRGPQDTQPPRRRLPRQRPASTVPKPPAAPALPAMCGARPAPSRSRPWTGNFGCTRAEAGTASTLSAPLKPQTCNTHPIEAVGKTNHSTLKPICTAPCPGRDPGVQRGHRLPWVTACPCPHASQSTGSRSRGLRPRQSCQGLGKGPVPHGGCWKCRFTPGLSPRQSRTSR